MLSGAALLAGALLAPVLPARPAAAGPRPEVPTLEQADALARKARAEQDEERKTKAVKEALAAYRAILEDRPKDRKLVPRVRRRRARLLKHAGRVRDALHEYRRIVEGRGRRRDKARALRDMAKLLRRGGDLPRAERCARRMIDEYGDQVRTKAECLLLLGRIKEEQDRPRVARTAYQIVVRKCEDQVKPAIEAYDRLAMLELRAGRIDRARRWLHRCTREYEKRATRKDRFGAYVGRLLGRMKAPKEIAKVVASKAAAAAAAEADTG